MLKTNFKEIKNLTLFSIPFIVMLIAQKVLHLISANMLGQVGVNALAAGILASSAYLIFIIFGIGIFNSVGILIAENYGANSIDKIKLIIFNGFIVVLLIAALGIFSIWQLPNLFSSLNQDPQVAFLTKDFLHAILWGFPALLCFSVLREFLAALEQQKIVTKIVIATIPFSILINYLFINGKLGLPALSIKGIGYANAVSEWFMFLCLFIYIKKHLLLKTYLPNFKFQQINWQIIQTILRIGMPIGFALSFETIMSAVLTIMMGYFGPFSLAAHHIAFQCISTVYMIPLGISLASALRISKSIGSKNHLEVKQTIYASLNLGVFFALLLMPIFLFMPQVLINCFIEDSTPNFVEVKNITIIYLTIGAFFLCFDALQGILSGCLRGFKDTFAPMLITIFTYLIIALGGGYLLAFKFDLQGSGLWLSLSLGLGFSCLLLSVRLWKHIKQNTLASKVFKELNKEYA